MEMKEVKSSNVTHIGYDGETMHITYKGGKTYEFKKITQKEYDSLINSKSIGSHLYKMEIKGKMLEKNKK